MLIVVITSSLFSFKFATPYEQYVDWPGVITSTLSSWPPEVRRGATSGLQRTCLNEKKSIKRMSGVAL